MGRVIYIDGPEKSGKSTLIKALTPALENEGLHVEVRHWGQVKPDDRVYSAPLQSDLHAPSDRVTIWDRGWAAEHVYGKLLNRQRRGAANPWLMEWLHGRAVVGNGLRCIALPASLTHNSRLRDETDLPVRVSQEYFAFLEYAQAYGYLTFDNNYEPEWVGETVEQILQRLPMARGANPQYWTHPQLYNVAPRVIVGEAKNPKDSATMAGAWLPFTSAKMCQFVQKYFGNEAFNFAWTNAEDFLQGRLDVRLLRGASQIFTFGESARSLVVSKGLEPAAAFAHPAFFSRWNTERGRAALRKFESEYKQAFGIS